MIWKTYAVYVKRKSVFRRKYQLQHPVLILVYRVMAEESVLILVTVAW